MATNASDEEIIEKRPSHPVATSCLVLAAVAMVGALVFQVAEISHVRAGMSTVERNATDPQKKLYEKNWKEFKAAADKLVADHDHPEITAAEPAPGAGADAGSTGDATPEKAPPAPGDAPADTPVADAPAAEEPAAPEPAGDEPAKDAAPPEDEASKAAGDEPAAEAGAADPAPGAEESASGDAPAAETPAPEGEPKADE